MKTKTNIGSKKMKDTIGMKPTELNEELTERVVKQCFENGKKKPIINNGKSKVKEKVLNRLNTDMLEMEECIDNFIIEDEDGYSCNEDRENDIGRKNGMIDLKDYMEELIVFVGGII